MLERVYGQNAVGRFVSVRYLKSFSAATEHQIRQAWGSVLRSRCPSCAIDTLRSRSQLAFFLRRPASCLVPSPWCIPRFGDLQYLLVCWIGDSFLSTYPFDRVPPQRHPIVQDLSSPRRTKIIKRTKQLWVDSVILEKRITGRTKAGSQLLATVAATLASLSFRLAFLGVNLSQQQ